MILYLITLMQDYSYDKISNMVNDYKNCVSYRTNYNNRTYIILHSKCYNYRCIPNTNVYIYNIFQIHIFKLPKRYAYSNMHI